MYIYTILVASLDIYKTIQGLMHVFFMLHCVNFYTFFFLVRPIDAIAINVSLLHIMNFGFDSPKQTNLVNPRRVLGLFYNFTSTSKLK